MKAWKRVALVMLFLPLQLLLVVSVRWAQVSVLPDGHGAPQQELLSAGPTYCTTVAQLRLEKVGFTGLPPVPTTYLSSYRNGAFRLHALRASCLYGTGSQGGGAIGRMVCTCCLRL